MEHHEGIILREEDFKPGSNPLIYNADFACKFCGKRGGCALYKHADLLKYGPVLKIDTPKEVVESVLREPVLFVCYCCANEKEHELLKSYTLCDLRYNPE
jgi:hypothetical protein